MKNNVSLAALAAFCALGVGCAGNGSSGVGPGGGPLAKLAGSVLLTNDLPAQNRQVRLVAGPSGKQVTTRTSSTGAFSATVETGQSYRIDVYKVNDAEIETQRQTGVVQSDLTLNPIKLSTGQ